MNMPSIWLPQCGTLHCSLFWALSIGSTFSWVNHYPLDSQFGNLDDNLGGYVCVWFFQYLKIWCRRWGDCIKHKIAKIYFLWYVLESSSLIFDCVFNLVFEKYLRSSLNSQLLISSSFFCFFFKRKFCICSLQSWNQQIKKSSATFYFFWFAWNPQIKTQLWKPNATFWRWVSRVKMLTTTIWKKYCGPGKPNIYTLIENNFIFWQKTERI